LDTAIETLAPQPYGWMAQAQARGLEDGAVYLVFAVGAIMTRPPRYKRKERRYVEWGHPVRRCQDGGVLRSISRCWMARYGVILMAGGI
jgi:hypothetical protein